jgi:hypothetical protein
MRHHKAPGSHDEHVGDAADLENADPAHEKVADHCVRCAQSTFAIGEDNPLPGGEANGVGNERPETPWTKCGMALTRKAPPKK